MSIQRFAAARAALCAFSASSILLAAAPASAQLFGNKPDPDAHEADAPPPPALKIDGLVELDVPRSQLRFGVDPDSVSIGKDDRIVRYVVVARSGSGVVNGIYEGINCGTGQVKVYARHAAQGDWVPVRDAKWEDIRSGMHGMYSLQIARRGACVGDAANLSVRDVLGGLRGEIRR
jgi:hypothetical protein